MDHSTLIERDVVPKDAPRHALNYLQNICKNIGNVGDEVGSGELFLFNPSSTTFVKHFMSSAVANEASDYVLNVFRRKYNSAILDPI